MIWQVSEAITAIFAIKDEPECRIRKRKQFEMALNMFEGGGRPVLVTSQGVRVSARAWGLIVVLHGCQAGGLAARLLVHC